MNRQQRRLAQRCCARDGHLTKTDGSGEVMPNCVRCGGPLVPEQEASGKTLVLTWHE